MYTASNENHGPFSIRYPRGAGVMTNWKTPLKEVKVGEGRKLTNGSDIAVLTVGHQETLFKTHWMLCPIKVFPLRITTCAL